MLTLKKMKADQGGFTLIEIAIVMVIIGLLVGGVLKGQAMIQNAKVKRVVKTGDEVRASVMTFFDRYGVYPGDENLANVPPGGPADTGCNGNGQIANNAERFGVFVDLSDAGLISGTYNGTSDLPTHAFGGTLDLYWVNPPGGTTPPTHYLRFYNLPAEVCMEMDTKYDDGDRTTGIIIGSAAYNPGATIATLYWQF